MRQVGRFQVVSKTGTNTSVRAEQNITEANRHASHAVHWARRDDQFIESLGGPHDAGGVHRLIRTNTTTRLSYSRFSPQLQAG